MVEKEKDTKKEKGKQKKKSQRELAEELERFK